MGPAVNQALILLRGLNDPLRYTILHRLMAGPANVAELVALCNAPQPKVSNHLAVLRDAELVTTERIGRHISYSLAGNEIASIIEALDRAAGGAKAAAARMPELAIARSCYDHLAGRLGCAFFDVFVERDALCAPSRATPLARKVRSALGDVALGPKAAHVFGELHIDLEQVSQARRQFATACSDWTETRPHLGGALGAALQSRLLQTGWIQRRSGTRALRVTPLGRDALLAKYSIDIEMLATL